MKKRILAMLSAVVMSGTLSLMVVPSSSLSAGAAESQTYGDLTYKNYGSWIEITDCDTSAVSVEIPDKIDGKTVRDIGKNAFSGCSELSQIIIPDCVKNIKQSAFNGCSNLTAIDLPDNLTTIDVCAFANCGFTEVIIPESVVIIDRLAFAATPITTITIPKNVETIGEGAFFCGPWGKGTLTEINVDTENTSFSVKDGVLFNYDKTELLCYPAGKKDTEYIMPETVTKLYVYAFDCCVNLEHVTISDHVKIIPENAFADCLNLKEITIPDSTTLIDNVAFGGCSQLVSVYMPKSIESISYSAFQFCSSLTDVYYAGTEEEWNKIENDSNEIIKANIHYNYNGNNEKVKGDVNADGVFSVADVTLLQKWLLTVPNTKLADWKAGDFYEDGVLDVFDLCLMKSALIETSISDWCKEPEDGETNRTIAKQIGDYALKELKNGTYTLETRIFLSNAPELMNEEMAEVFLNSDFLYLSFVDEHTVLLEMDKGLLDAYGYLITDESITFNENEYVSVPDEDYNGDTVYIEWAGDHLYYFSAGT